MQSLELGWNDPTTEILLSHIMSVRRKYRDEKISKLWMMDTTHPTVHMDLGFIHVHNWKSGSQWHQTVASHVTGD